LSASIPSLTTLRFWVVRTAAITSLRLSRQVHALPEMGRATHFTLIARMPALAHTRIGQIMAELQRHHPRHHYYPADAMHVTITNLNQVTEQEPDRHELFNRIRGTVENSHSFALTGSGLSVSPSSVFLQLYPQDKGLADLRRRLAVEVGDGDRRRRRGDSSRWDRLMRHYLFERIAFATLIRFSGPVTPAFLNEIGRHSETDFGTFFIEAFEIVRTDKFLSNAGTEIITRIAASPK